CVTLFFIGLSPPGCADVTETFLIRVTNNLHVGYVGFTFAQPMKQDYHCAKNESRKGKKSIGFCDSLQISEQKNASRFDRSGRGCKGKDTGDDVPPAGITLR
ncbi:hypothetical protein, partial [Klebsiella pneumoniae]|uniref:hypothetical protein n=1 Tax=Klebsiella pneumoniae TaxID=573 RepID=UPI001C6F8FA1